MAALVSPVSNADPPPASSAEQASSVSSCLPNQYSLLFAGFNQDHSRFGCGTARGFRVYDCRPFKAAWLRESSDGEGRGGIAFVGLLFRSHICALVGGGPTPGYPSNKVMIWDDRQSCCIGELSFRSQVCSVKLRRDRIVVALECKVYVYNFADLKLLLQIDTVANPKGLCAISSTSNSVVLACPSLIKGQVRLDFQGTKKPKFVSAHDSSVACLALTLDGQFLATASSKGTLIRIFYTLNGSLLQEVRRGVDRADIFSISFSSDAQWLAVSSDRGTIHVFSLKNKDRGEEKLTRRQDSNISLNNIPNSQDAALSPASLNPGSTFSFIKGILPRYFSSEWSFCQFRLPEEIKSVVAFDPEQQSSIMIVGSDGSFYRCTFDPVQGGKMVQQEHVNFMKPSV